MVGELIPVKLSIRENHLKIPSLASCDLFVHVLDVLLGPDWPEEDRGQKVHVAHLGVKLNNRKYMYRPRRSFLDVYRQCWCPKCDVFVR
jgi:hypothetical protein